MLYKETIEYIETKWSELCEEFHQNTPITICDAYAYVIGILNRIPGSAADTLLAGEVDALGMARRWRTIINDTKKGFNALAFTHNFVQGEPRKPMQLVDIELFINNEYLMRGIISNMDKMDDYRRYLDVTLRHEMGHILDDYRINANPKLTSSQYLKEAKRTKAIRNKCLARFGGEPEEDALVAYFSLPEEALANSLVNLSMDEIVAAHTAVVWY